jgi:acyl dehydratase
MPVLTDEQRALIGVESAPRPLPQPIDRLMALRWCEMLEDANPIYFDEAYARTTWLQGTFAPPTMLNTWSMAPVWPEGRDEPAAPRLEIEGCTTTIATNSVQEYLMPLRYGDELTVTTHVGSISDEKTTRLGTGHFYTTVTTYRNQHGQAVGRHIFTLFTYRPHAGASK